MEIFKLISLKVKDHDIFKDEIEFNFFQSSDSPYINKPYFTMVLGPNGTGKSNLLRLIIEIFKIAYEKSLHKPITKYVKGKYAIEYFFDDGYFTILNTLGYSSLDTQLENDTEPSQEKGIRIFKNGIEINFDLSVIPKSILAISIMLNDKFPIFDNDSYSIYSYLGVKRDSNTAGTRSYTTRTIDMVFKAAYKESFIHDTSKLLEFLELDRSLYISYYPRYKHIFFKGNMTAELLNDFYGDYRKYLKRESEPWSISVYEKIKKEEPEVIPKLAELLNYISKNLQSELESPRTKFYEFDLFDRSTDVIDNLKYLPYLQKLDLLSYPDIMLRKQGRYFSAENSSSGEYHLISTLISILACITENCLILIDEPEVSLHPNWQIKYIEFLNEIFIDYPSTHFIICSHSHFLVSDLESENSSILSLTKERNINGEDHSRYKLVSKSVPYNTFGWSAEQVLLEVFNVPTTRNYYIAEKVGEILELVSQTDRDDEKIRHLVSELVKNNIISLSDEDPLKPVINRLVEKYG